MTIVAVLFADTFPAIISDSLISTKGGVVASLNTPLTYDETREGLDGYRPVGVARKVWHGDNKTLLLYSGTVQHAQELLAHLNHLTAYRSYSLEAHSDLVRRVQRDNLNVSFIVLSSDGLEVEHYYYGAECYDDPRSVFGRVICIGSGKTELINTLKKIKGKPLPEMSLPTEYFETAFLNGLVAAADMTIDYLNFNKSEYARKSCGGYFELFYPTSLWSEVPKWMSNGCGHVFIEIVNDCPVIKRIVVSHVGQDNNTVLASVPSLDVPIVEGEVRIPVTDVTNHTIGDIREHSFTSNINDVLILLEISQMTVYGEARHTRCNHAYRTHNCVVATFGTLAHIKVEGSDLVLIFEDENPILPLIDRLKSESEQTCVVCKMAGRYNLNTEEYRLVI